MDLRGSEALSCALAIAPIPITQLNAVPQSRNPSYIFMVILMYKYSKNIYPVDELKKILSISTYRYHNNIPKFIFLCGEKLDSPVGNRNKIKDFYSRFRKDVIPIYAEDLFDKVKHEVDLLKFENFLAELSDNIILVLESYGSVCELGAFTSSSSIVKKLFVINDIDKIDSVSFINDGPIRHIREINGNSVFYANLKDIFQDDNLKLNILRLC